MNLLDLIGDSLSPYAMVWGPVRTIGQIMPDIVLEEVHRDEWIITDHPVEIGAAVSDHKFRRPAEVEIRAGASNCTGQSEGYVQEVYQQFLALGNQNEPFNISTGKRAYSNMLIRGIQVTTDEDAETALNIVILAREVLLTSTQSTGGGGGGSGGRDVGANAPSDAQASPQSTSMFNDRGVQQLATVDGVPSFAAMSNVQWQTNPNPYGDLRGAQGLRR